MAAREFAAAQTLVKFLEIAEFFVLGCGMSLKDRFIQIVDDPDLDRKFAGSVGAGAALSGFSMWGLHKVFEFGNSPRLAVALALVYAGAAGYLLHRYSLKSAPKPSEPQ